MTDADTSPIDRLIAFDAQRESVPGEHWLTFGLGLYLLLRRRRSVAGRLVSIAAGAVFVVRALTGRDGPIATLERRARADDDPGFAEVAAPWPYDQRVRLSAPRRIRRSDQSIPGAISSSHSLAPSS